MKWLRSGRCSVLLLRASIFVSCQSPPPSVDLPSPTWVQSGGPAPPERHQQAADIASLSHDRGDNSCNRGELFWRMEKAISNGGHRPAFVRAARIALF